jgi:hypothetical protein
VKQYVQPSAAELVKLQQFTSQTLGGTIQNANGECEILKNIQSNFVQAL